jgi:hypothetical protein
MKPTDRPAVILVVTILCGLAGALLASGFLHVNVFLSVVVIDGGTALGAAIALLLTSARTVAAPIRRDDPPPAWRPAPPQVAAPPTRQQPSHLALPLAGGKPASGRQWWTETNATAPKRDGATAISAAPAPPLSSYRAQDAMIAQCPRCGDFRIDAARHGSDYAFRCRNERCGNNWTWTPGTPWPAVVVRRNLT